MAERRSIIPPKAQIPVALVLTVCFAAMLWWRFAPEGKSEARKIVVVSETNYSLDEVRLLIEEVKRDEFLPVTPDNNLPESEQDPFLWDALEPVEPVVALAEEPDNSEEEALQERNERLAQLQLSGTMFIGQNGIAIINGEQLRAGDEIDGFTINNIGERTAVLVDDYGAEELEIEFDSLLPLTEKTEANS